MGDGSKTRVLRSVAWVGAVLLSGACYSGVSSFDGKDGVPLWQEDDDQDDGGPVADSYVPQPTQIRLLSAHEYANTVRDLLGVEPSGDLDYGEIGSGYDNGSDGQLGENLFSILQVEAERLAVDYVAGPMALDFPCFDPAAAVGSACIETVVDDLGRRAFRRPVDPQTRQQLLDFASTAQATADSPSHVMELLVTRMLMSPRFLYRTELGEELADDPSMSRLDPFEVASLISYSLVGSMPDEPLLADAEADELDPPRIREHVRRLLETDEGHEQMTRFFAQWLRVTELDTMAARPEDFPKLASPEQARSLREELGAFIEAVVFEDQGTLSDLLTRNVTFVDRHTAELYGASSFSDELEELVLDPELRGGVLTLASVMAVHSSSAEVHRDKPIRRGLLVKNQLLCEDVGLPSGIDIQSAAEDAIEDFPDFDEMTTREQLEVITSQGEICAACHVTFMPYGYLWSNFDAMGQYQTHFGDRLLDSYVDDLQLDGDSHAYDGVMNMLPDLIDSEQVPRCFTRNVARYATGLNKGTLVDFLTDELGPVPEDGERDVLTLIEDLFATPELYIREAQ